MRHFTLSTILMLTVILFSGLANTAKAGLITLNDSIVIGALNLSESFTSFYSYGNPYSASANTGYEQEDTAVMFLAEYNNELSLFTLLDAPATSRRSARTAEMSLSNFDLANVLLVDDPAESHVAGFSWRWVKCCTDGMIYHINDKDNFDIDIAFSHVKGLTNFTFLSFTDALSPATELTVGTHFSIQSVSPILPAFITSVPEPKTIFIFMLAFAGLTISTLRKTIPTLSQ